MQLLEAASILVSMTDDMDIRSTPGYSSSPSDILLFDEDDSIEEMDKDDDEDIEDMDFNEDEGVFGKMEE